MNTFIKKNEKFLKFYYIALRLSGWILLTLGISSFAITIILTSYLGPEAFGVTAINMPLRSLHLILFGILGLGIAQLIKYLYIDTSKPGFVLRHGSKFLYIYVALILGVMVMRNVITITYLQSGDIKNAKILFLSTSITSLVLFAAKALILIGIGQFLKRIMPVIEESKTLV